MNRFLRRVAAFEQSGEGRTVILGGGSKVADRLHGIPGLFGLQADTLRLLEMTVQTGIAECPVDFGAGESKSVLAEQHPLLPIRISAVFVVGRNTLFLQPIFQVISRLTAGQTGPDRIVYFVFGLVRFPKPIPVDLFFAFGIVKTVFGDQFFADFAVSDFDVLI